MMQRQWISDRIMKSLYTEEGEKQNEKVREQFKKTSGISTH